MMGLLSLMGCSQGDTVGSPAGGKGSDAIAFSADLPEQQAVTRSTPLEELLEEDNRTFRVWGYKNLSVDDQDNSDPADDVYGDLQTVFPGYAVDWHSNTAGTTTSNSHDWEYVSGDQTIKYWDWSAKAYRFFGATHWKVGADEWNPATDGAYENYKTYGASGTYGASDEYATYEITMLADASDEDEIDKTPFFSRLWFSTGNAVAYPDKQYGKPVTLEFVKPYARVRFLFTYSYPPEGIKLGRTIKKFRPTVDVEADDEDKVKIPVAGTFTAIYPLTGTDTRETFRVSGVTQRIEAFTEDYVAEGTKKWYTVLPNNTQGSYTLTVDINGIEKTAVVPANYMTWLPSYSYTYIFKITEQGGVEIELVQAAVTRWDYDPSTDYTVYNW